MFSLLRKNTPLSVPESSYLDELLHLIPQRDATRVQRSLFHMHHSTFWRFLALPLMILALQLLMIDGQAEAAQSMQPTLGASLSWNVSSQFRQNLRRKDRSVTFTLRSAVRMASTCNYTLLQNISCSPSPQPDPNDTVVARESEATALEVAKARAVQAVHGVLCVGQVMPTAKGNLEFIYSPETDAHACASDASDMVNERLFNGSYLMTQVSTLKNGKMSETDENLDIKSGLGKVNRFLVTSLHTNNDPADSDHRIQGMNIAVGLLTHTGAPIL
jgi:hypothetical protein